MASLSDYQAVKVERVKRKAERPRYAVHAALWLVCFVLALPLIYALFVATLSTEQSFATPQQMLRVNDSPIEHVREFRDNVRELFTQRGFDRIVVNTLIMTLVVVIAKTAFALLAGLAFVFFRFPGKWFLFFFVLLTLLMPTEIILLPLFGLVSKLEWGNKNPMLALTIPFLATAAGTFLFRQHFSNIPRELVEAAQMDGATPLRFMWSVLLPMSMNVMVAHGVLQFISMWNQYLWPKLIASDPANMVIQQGVANVSPPGSQQADFGLLMAAGVVASIPPLIVFILLQRQFMNGFTLTRDK